MVFLVIPVLVLGIYLNSEPQYHTVTGADIITKKYYVHLHDKVREGYIAHIKLINGTVKYRYDDFKYQFNTSYQIISFVKFFDGGWFINENDIEVLKEIFLDPSTIEMHINTLRLEIKMTKSIDNDAALELLYNSINQVVSGIWINCNIDIY